MRRLTRLALLPAASLAVHQLRYLLAVGSHAGPVLQRQGHTYLHSLAPWIVLLSAGGAGAFLWGLGRALAGHRTLRRYTLSLSALWILCAACLLAMFVAQELLEGLLAQGHPPGLIGVFGYGGWWSIPAALCVGLVLATILHGARWVLDEVTRRRLAEQIAGRRSAPAAFGPQDVLLPRLSPLAAGGSQRGPPL
jgi:hypothetical protein